MALFVLDCNRKRVSASGSSAGRYHRYNFCQSVSGTSRPRAHKCMNWWRPWRRQRNPGKDSRTQKALIASLIAVAAITSMTTVGTKVNGVLSNVACTMK